MVKKINWSSKAQNDRKEILQYWINRNASPTYSKKLNSLFIEAVNLISKFPKIGKQSGYKETRIKVVRDYLVVYKESDTQISIIAIWDGRQDPLKLKTILK